MEQEKIKAALAQIKVDSNCNWYVPNRTQLNMTILEFAEFERKRLMEFENEDIKKTKYKHHYK